MKILTSATSHYCTIFHPHEYFGRLRLIVLIISPLSLKVTKTEAQPNLNGSYKIKSAFVNKKVCSKLMFSGHSCITENSEFADILLHRASLSNVLVGLHDVRGDALLMNIENK